MRKGFAYFERAWFHGSRPYLDGHRYTFWFEVEAGYSSSSTSALITGRTHAGTAFTQLVLVGEKAPAVINPLSWDTGLVAADESDWQALLLAHGEPGLVQWVPGEWLWDVFPSAEAGREYRLSRPPAWTIDGGGFLTVPGPLIMLDGVPDPSAATLDGQSVTAEAAGRLAIYYPPAFWVKVSGVQKSPTNQNYMVAAVQMEEHIVGAFD